MGGIRALCLFVLVVVSGPALAQANNEGSGADRTVTAYRLAAGEDVTIDGRLDEAFWSRVAPAANFRQTEPVASTEIQQPTRVRVAFDAQNLYIAWEIVETRPGYLRASVRERDGPIGVDDWIRVFIDPFQTGRNSYNFELNANGSRFDGVIENNLTERGAWNAVWEARVYRHDEGWNAEMRIPFRNLSYPSDGSDWGIDFSRVYQTEFGVERWAQHDQLLGLNNLEDIGRLQGISGIDNGIGLEIEAFATGRYTHVWEEGMQEDDVIGDLSGNAYYKITDSLTGTLTVNTDFSDTPLDPRIVSTSRFATFFSETRDFFLQDSAIFEFGGRNFTETSNGLPFNSRRIGLVNGQIVDLMAGAKLSGRALGHDIGLLVTQMGGTENFESQTLATGRVSRNITDDFKIGGVFTAGDPDGQVDNYVGGVDVQYRQNFDGGNWSVEAFLLGSSTSGGIGEGLAYGTQVRYVTDPFFIRFRTKHLEEGYNPELGFVNRSETRWYNVSGRRRWRPGGIVRHMDIWQWNDYFYDLDHNLISRENGGSFEGNWVTGDYWGMFVANIYENVDSDFDLPGGPTVVAGDYTWNRAGIWIGGSDSRVISPHFEISCCEFFGGDRISVEANFEWRPGPMFALEWNNDWNYISMPNGNSEIYVTGLEGTISFTPDMQLSTEIQYDNISGNLNVFSRFNWEFAPGAELFVGLGHNADVPATHFPHEFESNVSTVTVRLGRTFAF